MAIGNLFGMVGSIVNGSPSTRTQAPTLKDDIHEVVHLGTADAPVDCFLNNSGELIGGGGRNTDPSAAMKQCLAMFPPK